MIGRIILGLLSTALGLLLILGLLVAANILRIGPDGIEIAHNSGESSASASANGSMGSSEDIWAKAYREKQERDRGNGIVTPEPPPVAAIAPPLPASSGPAIRIRAGINQGFKDADGNEWEPDNGFDGGGIVDRGNIDIGNTRSPDLYRGEHFGMNGFHRAVANADYLVKLHFAETWKGIDAPGKRIFGVTVQGQPLGNIDVFAEAGGARRALIKTIKAHVADGVLRIEFHKTDKDGPEINGIEILPDGR